MDLYSIKMRGSKNNKHISGSENIVYEKDIEKTLSSLVKRAMKHDKGKSDFINFKIEKIDMTDIEYIVPLEVTTVHVEKVLHGSCVIEKILHSIGISKEKVHKINFMINNIKDMRGAILLDVNSMKRLEKDSTRGIRVTYMDLENNNLNGLGKECTGNTHFMEAIVLASKVMNYKDIIGEICISDDPNYTTGYVATKEFGYVRITNLKEKNIPFGGRIFLYNGLEKDIDDCIKYLETKKVVVKNNIKMGKKYNYEDFMEVDLNGCK